MEAGPDLIDTFLPRSGLLEPRPDLHAPPGSEWLKRLIDLVEDRPQLAGTINLQQNDLFEQYTRVLVSLSRDVPLLLFLDDLQWADAGSISLLFHLGRHLRGSRILVLGAYRPEEVAIGRQGARHPLEPVVNEFQQAISGT